MPAQNKFDKAAEMINEIIDSLPDKLNEIYEQTGVVPYDSFNVIVDKLCEEDLFDNILIKANEKALADKENSNE
jgi:hypothetical protein